MKTTQHLKGNKTIYGGISIWTFIVIGILTLVVAISLIGYQVLSKKVAQSNKEKIDLDIIILSNKTAFDTLKREREGRELAAKIKREEFILEASSLTNKIATTLARVNPTLADWKNFMDGPTGKPAAKHEGIISMVDIFVKENPITLSYEHGKSHLEFVRLVLLTAQSMQGEDKPGNPHMEAFSNAKEWINKTEEQMQKLSGFMEKTFMEVRTKEEPPKKLPEMTLNAGIQWRRGNIIFNDTANKAASDKAAKIQQDKLDQEKIDAELKRIAREHQEELDRRNKEAAAKIAKDKLIAEAQSAETKDLLRPFLETGVYDQTGLPLSKPGPVSLRSLSGKVQGFTAGKSVDGLIRAASDNKVDRFRWPRSYRDPQLVEKAQQAMDKLNRLGPTLVELGMLNP